MSNTQDKMDAERNIEIAKDIHNQGSGLYANLAKGGKAKKSFLQTMIDNHKETIAEYESKLERARNKKEPESVIRDLRKNIDFHREILAEYENRAKWSGYTGKTGEDFKLGTPVVWGDVSGEVIVKDGKRAISLYPDRNYSGDKERIRFPKLQDWENIKTYYEANKIMETGGKTEDDYTKNLGMVEVIFINPEYNYSTNVSGDTTEEQAREYFVGKYFNVGKYPEEKMKKVIDIKFHPKGTYSRGGKMKKGDIGKSGKQYGYTLSEYEAAGKKSGLFVSPTEYWNKAIGSTYKDFIGRTQRIGESDKGRIMNSYAYKIMIGLDLGSKLIPESAKRYAQDKYTIEEFVNVGKFEDGGTIRKVRVDIPSKGEQYATVKEERGDKIITDMGEFRKSDIIHDITVDKTKFMARGGKTSSKNWKERYGEHLPEVKELFNEHYKGRPRFKTLEEARRAGDRWGNWIIFVDSPDGEHFYTMTTFDQKWVAPGNVYGMWNELTLIEKSKSKKSMEQGGYTKGNYVAVSENKDGYWTIISKPSSFEDAKYQADMPTVRGEITKVVTADEAKAHKKVLGREYLSMEQGGEITNQYEGKLAGDIWDAWTTRQKEHFLEDHLPDEVNIFNTHKYTSLPLYVQKEVIKHTSYGQYASGGEIKGRVEVGEILYASTGVPVKVLEYDPSFGGRVRIERADGYQDEWTRKSTHIWKPLSKFSRTNPMVSMASGGLVNGLDVDEILKHFLMAGLWASYDDNEVNLDINYSIDDVDNRSKEEIKKGIRKFIHDNAGIIKRLGLSEESIGHDLFLDSQGHGVGFWDRKYIPKEDGKILSESASKIFPSDQPYVGDDGKVHFNTRSQKDLGGLLLAGAVGTALGAGLGYGYRDSITKSKEDAIAAAKKRTDAAKARVEAQKQAFREKKEKVKRGLIGSIERLEHGGQVGMGDNVHIPSINKSGVIVDFDWKERTSGSPAVAIVKFSDGTMDKFTIDEIERINDEDKYSYGGSMAEEGNNKRISEGETIEAKSNAVDGFFSADKKTFINISVPKSSPDRKGKVISVSGDGKSANVEFSDFVKRIPFDDQKSSGGSMARGGATTNPEVAWNETKSREFKKRFLVKHNTDEVVANYIDRPYDGLLQRMQAQWETYISKREEGGSMAAGGKTNTHYNRENWDVQRSSVGNKQGWAFSNHTNVTSGLYKRRDEAEAALDKYLKTGKLDWYGSAEMASGGKTSTSIEKLEKEIAESSFPFLCLAIIISACPSVD